MSIAKNLADQCLAMRKARDPMAIFLNSVLAKAKDLAKAQTHNGQTPDVSDAHAVQAIRSGLKTADENISLLHDQTSDTAQRNFAQAQAERALLLSLLPQQASPEDVRAAAEAARAAASDPKAKGLMGQIMQQLHVQFGAALDRSEASRIVREVLATTAS